MHTPRSSASKLRAVLLSSLLGAVACGTGNSDEPSRDVASEQSGATGAVEFRLDIGGEMIVGGVRYQITGNNIPAIMGVMTEDATGLRAGVSLNLPAGRGYTMIIAAYRAGGGEVCMLTSPFNVVAGMVTTQVLNLQCDDVGEGDSAPLSDAGAGSLVDRVDSATPDASVVGANQPDATAPADVASDATRRDSGFDRETGVRADAANSEGTGDAGPGGELVDAQFAVGEDGGSAPLGEPDSGVGITPTADASVGSEGEEELDAAPAECEECSARECARQRGFDRARDCYEASGVASAGPARGIGNAVLCEAAIDCAHRASCADESLLDCYCGEADIAMCVLTGPGGACREELENLAQTTDPARLIAGLGGNGTALGAAARILQCEAQRCRAACFAEP